MKEILLAAVPATIPTLAVLIGILLNQTGNARLESRISSLEARLYGRINSLEARLDGRISALAGEIVALHKQLHDDVVMLVGRDTDRSERLTRLEEKFRN